MLCKWILFISSTYYRYDRQHSLSTYQGRDHPFGPMWRNIGFGQWCY